MRQPQQGTGHPAPCDAPTPQESTQTFIKRVVGGPGDRISIGTATSSATASGSRTATSPTAAAEKNCTFRQTITVPPGDYFMMGDNRGFSDDSRFWGPVPDKWVIGVAFFTYWPPDRIGFL